jgi:histidinol phosphatase-like PHP family hydrolase
MASTNEEVAALLREYAELSVMTGGDQFRARNYEKAAKAVAGYPDDIATLPDAALTRIGGVGASIAAKITEYRRTGSIAALDELRAKIPPGVLEIAKVPGLGPKKALQLNRELGIDSIDELEDAVRRGRLRGLSGFGAKSEERILRGIGVITHDAALRDALRALPPDAGEDEIEAVLLAQLSRAGTLAVEITATSAQRSTGTADGGAAALSDGTVRAKDLRGDLHTHTDLTDGVASLREMVAAAIKRGYEYYAVTDHAPNLVMQRMTADKMLTQRAEVRALADETGFELLHGTELNIAPDGSVDWDADFLDGFDVRVASVHSHFDQDRAAMTKRFVTACENPYVNIIGHPVTRKLGRRPPVDVDLGALYEACARTGTALEINASPERMDLPPEHIAAAKQAGAAFAIDTDAHSLVHLRNMRYGVAAARLGGLAAGDVINAWPLETLTEFLRKGRSPQRLPTSSITFEGRLKHRRDLACGHAMWSSSTGYGRRSEDPVLPASMPRPGRMTWWSGSSGNCCGVTRSCPRTGSVRWPSPPPRRSATRG